MQEQKTNSSARDLRALARGALARAPAAIPRPALRWKTRLAVPATIMGAVIALLVYSLRETLTPARDVTVIPVVVKASADTGGAAIVQAPGWVEADPYPINVAALADGIVKEVLVLEGQPVKAGQVVAQLIDDDARLALVQAEADLGEKRAALQAAQTRWDNPVERQRDIDTAAARVAETQAEIKRLDHEIAAEIANADELREEVKVSAQALNANSATSIELIRAQKSLEARLATLEAIRARGPMLAAQLDRENAELWAAKESFRLRIDERKALDETKALVQMSQAAREEAALRLSRMQVRSPADGVVMARLIEPGAKLVRDMDQPDSTVAIKLYDRKHLQVRVDVPLADASRVGLDQPAQVIVSLLPDRTFAGKVSRIVHQADIQKNTLQVKVAIIDPDPRLKPEMLARAKIETQSGSTTSASQTVFAPENLIIRDGQTTRAWVVDARRGAAEVCVIQTGQTRQDGWISIISGLNPGDLLISDPSGLREGQRVRVISEAKGASHAAD